MPYANTVQRYLLRAKEMSGKQLQALLTLRRILDRTPAEVTRLSRYWWRNNGSVPHSCVKDRNLPAPVLLSFNKPTSYFSPTRYCIGTWWCLAKEGWRARALSLQQ